MCWLDKYFVDLILQMLSLLNTNKGKQYAVIFIHRPWTEWEICMCLSVSESAELTVAEKGWADGENKKWQRTEKLEHYSTVMVSL